jgi:hypothetical protein
VLITSEKQFARNATARRRREQRRSEHEKRHTRGVDCNEQVN